MDWLFIKKKRKEMEWISVKDRLPDIAEDVAIWVDVDQGYWFQGFYEEGLWYDSVGERVNNKSGNIAYWMILKTP